MQKIDLSDLADGAVGERANIELQKIAANILDPNTDHKKVRELTIKVKFKATENRDMAMVDVEATSKLAPAKTIPTTILIGKDNDGKAVAQELKSGKKDQTYFDNDGTIRDHVGNPVQPGQPAQPSNVVGGKFR